MLALLLMLGAALGALEAGFLPDAPAGFWPLVSMGAILGGTMRSPLTGILFAAEVSGDFNALLPLSVAVVVAHAFTVLVLDRSVLTEKVARRGYHVTREYEIDPLEVLFVREVMSELREDAPAEPTAYFEETLKSVTLKMATAHVTTLRVLDAQSNVVGHIDLEDVLVARRRERFAPLPIPNWVPIPRWVPLVGPRE